MKWMHTLDGKMQTLQEALTPLQRLSGNGVKLLACLAMFVDHFSKIVLWWMIDRVWFPLSEAGLWSWEQFQARDNFVRIVLYGVGSTAFPLFCFLLAEGFCHTKNKKRYLGGLGLFALISELPFDLSFFSELSKKQGTYPFYWSYQNVFFTLFLGVAVLWGMESLSHRAGQTERRGKQGLLVLAQIAVVALGAVLAEGVHCDYGSRGVLFVVCFFVLRKNRLYQILGFLLLYIATTGNQPTVYLLISMGILLLYNGSRGKWRLKYFFYLFYPAHIFLLYLTTLALEQGL